MESGSEELTDEALSKWYKRVMALFAQEGDRMSYRHFTGGSLTPWHGGKVRTRAPTRKQTEPLVGWRAWRIDGHRLQSLVVSHIWEGPVFRAEGKPDVLKPLATCGGNPDAVHGIYSFKDFRRTLPYLRRFLPYPRGEGSPKAIGRLELTGRVIVHEAGYRAEVATITDLFIPDVGDPDLPKELEQTYHCNVWTDFEEFLTQVVEREENEDR